MQLLDNRKKLIIVLTLIFLILGALGLRLWASERYFETEGPANVKKGPDGLIYIVSEARLYVLNQDGDVADIIPLDRFGLEKARGDFWIFNNGDVLLREETETKLSCKREFETFFRTGSSKQDKIAIDNGILKRCNVSSGSCTVFGSGTDAYKKIGAFKVLVDEEQGDVYITDTPAHQLLMYDLSGKLKRKSDMHFLYPNGIVRASDGLLYVADTNHHVISAVNPGYSEFGRIERSFSIYDRQKISEKEWPFALGQDKNNRWWVINAGPEMRNGELVIYEESGRVFRHVELPEDAEPTAVAILENRVLVTDPNLMRVYSIALNGELQDDFGSLLFKLDCSEILRTKNFYSLLSSAMLYVIFLVSVSAIIVAWRAQVSTSGSRKEQAEPGDVELGPESIVSTTCTVPLTGAAASHGWTWLNEASQIVKKSSRIYFVLILISVLRWQGVVRIPKAGYLTLMLVSPLLDGIMMLLTRLVVQKKSINMGYMRIKPHLPDLLLAGAAYCLLFMLTAAVAQFLTGLRFIEFALSGQAMLGNGLPHGLDASLVIGLVILAIMSYILFAMYWFAPPLIVLKGYSFWNAMMTSLAAVFANRSPFYLYGVVVCGVFLLLVLMMFIVPSLIFAPLGLTTFIKPMANIMAILFMPVFAPILALTVYTSYVDVFETKPGARETAQAEIE